jgi:hypothetical protein
MAAVSKSGTPSPTTLLWPPSNQHSGLIAGEDLGAGDACYIKTSDGKVYKSTGAAANAAAQVDGFTPQAYKSGIGGVTLVFGIEFGYGSGLSAGTSYYLSGTTAGGLDTATSTGGTVVIARSVDDQRVFVRKSY